jgi:hypothetical protein
MACGRCGKDRKIRARGLCGACYNRISKYGDEAPPKVRHTATEWLALLDRSGLDCWLWPGPEHSEGYGLAIEHGLQMLAHRFAWEVEVGPIPEGYTIDHGCLMKLCVRVDHLEPVTLEENLRRMAENHPRQQKTRVGRCPHGDHDDIYYDPTGKRVCRICRRERMVMWRADRA